MQKETQKLMELAMPVIPKNWNLYSDLGDLVHGLPTLNIHLLLLREDEEIEYFGQADNVWLWPKTLDYIRCNN